MLDGRYKGYLSLLALKSLTKAAAIPNRELCMGESERLESIPVLVFKDIAPAEKEAVRESYYETPYEKVGVHFEFEQLEHKDFMFGGYIGDPLERV